MIRVQMFCFKLVVLQYFIAFSTCIQLEDHNQCIGTFCYNGGTCLTPKGMKQSICSCLPGFWGRRCQHRAGDRPCLGHLCENGVCDSEGFIRLPKKVVRYGCKCNRNFVGAFCNTTKHEAMCNLRADCQSKFMQITVKDNQCHCSCREGYTGSDCSVQLPCARIHCEHKAECVNGKCNCSGTLYTGRTCERINIPLLKQLNVENLCQARDAPKCNRNINARCTLALNHEKKVIAYCNCTPPWTGNRECTKKFDACELTEFEKSCVQDYRACDLDAPVEESRCKNGGLCLSDAKSLKGQARKFLCKCKGNFVGPFCEFEDYCKYKDPCPTEHHECRLTSDQDGLRLQKLCLCKPGYTGKNCERKLTDSQIMAKCINNKCSNTSVCIPCIRLRGICTTKEQHRRGYICACDPSQSGEFCEHHVSPCVTHECKNHGTCKEVDEYTYKCICKPGITGLHCDVIDNMCKTRTPCVHGICTVNKHIREGYKCECKHGYRGVQCELPAYILFGKWSTSREVIAMAYSAMIGLIVTVCFLIYAMSQPEELSPDSESEDESVMKNSESGLAERTISRLMLSGLLVGLIGAVEKCPSDIDKNLYNGYELRKGYCLTYLELDEEKKLLSDPSDDWFEFAKKECAEKLPNGTIHPAICTESSKLDIKYDYEFDNYDATALRGFKILSAHLIKAANSNETTLNVEIEFSNGTRLTVTEDTAQHLLCIKNRLKHILKRKDFPLCNDIEISIPPYAKHGTMSIVGSKIKSFFNCKNEHPYAFVLCASTYAYNCVEHVNKNYSQGCTECRPGFTGALCNHDTRVQASRRAYEGKIINGSSDITVYEEQHIQCQNGATEFFLINRTVCKCPKGFTGNACEQSLKQGKRECYNGGTQVVLENHTDCACLSNFTGSHCQIRINQLNCTPGYHLSNTTGYEICLCSKTNTTYSCLTVLKNYCKNKGIPVMRRSNVVNCECATNLSGERCEIKESKDLNKAVIFSFTFLAVFMISLLVTLCICPPKYDDQPKRNNH